MAMDDPSRRSSPTPAGDAESAAQTRAQFTAMLRGSALPTVGVAVVAVAVAALADARAAWSAALGAGVVLAFFTLSLLVMRQTAHLSPVAVMSAVLASYTAKIIALAVVMVALRDVRWVDGQALALSVIVCTLVWLAFEMRAFTRLRVLVAPGAAATTTAPHTPDDAR